jgi:hypothetical protein
MVNIRKILAEVVLKGADALIGGGVGDGTYNVKRYHRDEYDMKASKDLNGLIIADEPAIKQYLELKKQGFSSKEAYDAMMVRKKN